MICFVEFFRNTNGLYEAGQTIRTACIRALMKKNGVPSSVYRNQSLASVNEIADDIMLLAEDGVVFIRNGNCDAICKAVFRAIREENDVPVWFIDGDADDGEEQTDDALNGKIAEIIRASGGSELREGIREVSPYQEETAALRDLPRYGIWLGGTGERKKEVVFQEIALASEHLSGSGRITFRGAPIQSESGLLELVENLGDDSDQDLTFEIPVERSAFTKKAKARMKQKRACADLYLKEDLNAVESAGLLAELKNDTVSRVHFPAHLAEGASGIAKMVKKMPLPAGIRLFPEGEFDPDKADGDVAERLLQNTKTVYVTFFRGMMNSRTGLYHQTTADGYVHHVLLTKPEPEWFEADRYTDVTAVNASILFDEENGRKESGSGMIRFDRWGIAHAGSGEAFAGISDGDPFPYHLVRTQNHRVLVDDLAWKSDSELYRVSYSWMRERIESVKQDYDAQRKKLYLIRVESKQDWHAFLEDAQSFCDTHRIGDLPLAYGIMENSCRFLLVGECSMDKNPRIFIGENGDAHYCSEEIPGVPFQRSIYELTHGAFTSREKILSERGCYSCATRSLCPRCAQLTGGMKEGYCDKIRTMPYLMDYTILSFYIKELTEAFEDYRYRPLEEFGISTEYMQDLLDEKPEGEVSPWLPKYTACIHTGDSHILWSSATSKFFRLGVEFAYFIDLLLARQSMSTIRTALGCRFNLSEQKAAAQMKTMADVLTKSQVLYRPIVFEKEEVQ
jgi:hypothetical protein